MPMNSAEHQRRFEHHPPRTETERAEHEAVRRLLANVALELDDALPDGREKSLVLTKIEEAHFWAHAAMARARFEQKP